MLILAAVSIMVISLSSGIFAVSLTKSIENSVYYIEELTILRGSFQRLSKYEIARIEKNDLIDNIDKRVEELEQLKLHLSQENYSGTIFIDRVGTSWVHLKESIIQFRQDPNELNKEALIQTSEDVWTKSDNLVSLLLTISNHRVNILKNIYVFVAIQLLLGLLTVFIIRKYVKQNLEFHVEYDSLTHLYNRRYFDSALNKEIISGNKCSENFSLIMFDVDHFKKINDKYGHDIGDCVLKELSDLILQNIRKNDLLARIGGEEFAIIALNTKVNEAFILAEKIRKFVESHDFTEVGQVTISIGVTEYTSGDDNDTICKRVDNALYNAKESGRNKSVIKTEPYQDSIIK